MAHTESYFVAPKALYVGGLSGEGIRNREMDEKRKLIVFHEISHGYELLLIESE